MVRTFLVCRPTYSYVGYPVFEGGSIYVCMMDTEWCKGPSKYREGSKFTTGMFHLELEVHLVNGNCVLTVRGGLF